MMRAEQRLDRSCSLYLAGELSKVYLGLGSLLDLVGELCWVSMALKFHLSKVQLKPFLSASSQ